MKQPSLLPFCAGCALCIAACTSDDTSSVELDASSSADASSNVDDAGETRDAMAPPDASSEPLDAAPQPPDAAVADAAVADAAVADAGPIDAALDASVPDAALVDAALPDSGSSSGLPDASEPIADASTEPGDAAPDAADTDAQSLQDAASPIVDLGTKALLDLTDVKQNPEAYEWFDFRPNVKKLILAGAAETEHIAILWYTVTDGAVGLHYHSKTECVYVIDGTQTDAKGVYPTGTVYYNPPTSGHAISDSSGFFLLSYAAPPDFASTDLIEDYTPVRIDTEDPDLMTEYAFDTDGGVSTYAVPLQSEGGMSSEFIALDGDEGYAFSGNYVLVLEGTCEIEGVSLGEDSLVVTDAVEPEMFSVSSTDGASCLALGISF